MLFVCLTTRAECWENTTVLHRAILFDVFHVILLHLHQAISLLTIGTTLRTLLCSTIQRLTVVCVDELSHL